MSEVKKVATRDSYGNALAELGKEFPELSSAGSFLLTSSFFNLSLSLIFYYKLKKNLDHTSHALLSHFLS